MTISTPNSRRGFERSARRSGLGTARSCALAIAALCLIGSGCAGSTRPRGPYLDQVAANEAALELLEFGMTRAQSAAIMGEQTIRPPWANSRGIGPQELRNPFDGATFESPSGETYEVDRYAVGLYGQSGCPFIRGEARLVPLIFLDGKLVGWRWSYLASVLQRPIQTTEKSWSFGQFCGQASGAPD
jgi:hypothetical protein